MIVKEKVKRKFAHSNIAQKRLYGILLFAYSLIVTLIYLSFTNENLGGADSAELITVSYNLGIAHPPGYPLFIVLGKIFSLLTPFSNVVFTYNLFATLCFLLTLYILWKTLQLLDVHPLSILTVASFYIFSPTSIHWFTTGEVFSLHILLCSGGIYLTVATIKRGSIGWTGRLLGLIAGLGASNHHTIVFLFPGFFIAYSYFWIRLDNNTSRFKEFSWLVFFFLLGAVFYVQPLLATMLQDVTISALGLEIRSFQDLSDLFLRRMYGTFSMSGSHEVDLVPGYWLLHYLKTSLLSWQGVGPAVILLAFSFFIKTIISEKSLLNFTYSLWLIGSLVFVLLIQTEPTEVFVKDITPRMFLMPSLIITLCALLYLNDVIKGLLQKNSPPLTGIVILLALFSLWLNIGNCYRQVHQNPVDIQMQNGRDILTSCPQDGLLLLDTDAAIFSVFYLQNVMHYRDDVLSVAWPLRDIESYRNRILVKLKDKIPENSEKEKIRVSSYEFTSKDLISLLLKAGNQVHILTRIEDFFSETENIDFVTIDTGITKKLLDSATENPAPPEILLDNIAYLQFYLTWLSQISPEKQSVFNKFIIETYRQYFLHMMFLQMYMDEIVIPVPLFEQICLMIKTLNPDDIASDYFLGLFYVKFGNNSDRAKHFFETFVSKSNMRPEYENLRNKSLKILTLLDR